MTESILTSTKKLLGLDVSYTAFDLDILTHINSAFSTLNQLGIGPEDGYAIEDASATWDAFFGTNLKYSSIKSYVYLYVRILFDPPSTGHHLNSAEKLKLEYEWRLNVVREETEWVNPEETVDVEEEVLDGGPV